MSDVGLETLTWPLERAGEALEALARSSSLPLKRIEIPAFSTAADGAESIGRWIESAADYLGLEAEQTDARYGEVEHLLRHASPALIKLEIENEPRVLAIVRGHRSSITVISPQLALHRLSLEKARAALCEKFERPLVEGVDRLLLKARVPRRRRKRAREAILRERLVNVRFSDCWLLRLAPETSFVQLLRRAGLLRRLAAVICAYALLYLLWILSWIVVGRGALRGHFEEGWFAAWALLLLSIVLLRLFATWSQGYVVIKAGSLLKQRLLAGALQLDADHVRQQGMGQLLGRVVEADAVEALALGGGFLGLFASLELMFGMFVLGAGAGGPLHALLLLGLIIFAALLGWYYYSHRLRWTTSRLGLTQELVERMVGYRTRAAQQAREHWHDGEDQTLENYLARAVRMDAKLTHLLALVPRGWLILGLCGLIPAFVAQQQTPVALAISLGGILFSYKALGKATLGISHLAGAAIAWKQVAPLFHQAASRANNGARPASLAPVTKDNGRARGLLMEANNIFFRYPTRGEQVLRGCNVRVYGGDRILLEGSSGGGKSTLASLLTGLRQPESGLLLLGGLDRQTLGSEDWRRRVVAAPQFHENHVLTETFAFNLLMGRRWPPLADDLREAKSICLELGLGDLLERMPAGMFQMVGDTGWQLSHGEKSRLYIARALLQGADMIILDESFAALDPETLRRAMDCVLKRARTLLVIAHP